MMSECNTHWQANVIRVSWHMECIKAEQFTEFIMLFILFWVTVFAQSGKKNSVCSRLLSLEKQQH